LRVIVPAIGTVVAGVNTRTGVTGEPAPVYARVMEVKAVIAATMGSALMVAEVVTSPDDAIEKVPAGAAAAAPRVKPDSVMVTAAVPVGLPPIMMTRVVEDPEPEVPVIPATLDAPAMNEAVPVK